MAIYERELTLFSESGNIRMLEIREQSKPDDTEDDKRRWILYAQLVNQEKKLITLTMRKTIRTWRSLDTLYDFIKKVCPNVPLVTLVVAK